MKIPATVMDRFAEYCGGRAFNNYFVLKLEQAYENELPYATVLLSRPLHVHVVTDRYFAISALRRTQLGGMTLRCRQDASSSFQQLCRMPLTIIIFPSFIAVVCWA